MKKSLKTIILTTMLFLVYTIPISAAVPTPECIDTDTFFYNETYGNAAWGEFKADVPGIADYEAMSGMPTTENAFVSLGGETWLAQFQYRYVNDNYERDYAFEVKDTPNFMYYYVPFEDVVNRYPNAVTVADGRLWGINGYLGKAIYTTYDKQGRAKVVEYGSPSDNNFDRCEQDISYKPDSQHRNVSTQSGNAVPQGEAASEATKIYDSALQLLRAETQALCNTTTTLDTQYDRNGVPGGYKPSDYAVICYNYRYNADGTFSCEVGGWDSSSVSSTKAQVDAINARIRKINECRGKITQAPYLAGVANETHLADELCLCSTNPISYHNEGLGPGFGVDATGTNRSQVCYKFNDTNPRARDLDSAARDSVVVCFYFACNSPWYNAGSDEYVCAEQHKFWDGGGTTQIAGASCAAGGGVSCPGHTLDNKDTLVGDLKPGATRCAGGQCIKGTSCGTGIEDLRREDVRMCTHDRHTYGSDSNEQTCPGWHHTGSRRQYNVDPTTCTHFIQTDASNMGGLAQELASLGIPCGVPNMREGVDIIAPNANCAVPKSEYRCHLFQAIAVGGINYVDIAAAPDVLNSDSTAFSNNKGDGFVAFGAPYPKEWRLLSLDNAVVEQRYAGVKYLDLQDYHLYRLSGGLTGLGENNTGWLTQKLTTRTDSCVDMKVAANALRVFDIDATGTVRKKAAYPIGTAYREGSDYFWRTIGQTAPLANEGRLANTFKPIEERNNEYDGIIFRVINNSEQNDTVELKYDPTTQGGRSHWSFDGFCKQALANSMYANSDIRSALTNYIAVQGDILELQNGDGNWITLMASQFNSKDRANINDHTYGMCQSILTSNEDDKTKPKYNVAPYHKPQNGQGWKFSEANTYRSYDSNAGHSGEGEDVRFNSRGGGGSYINFQLASEYTSQDGALTGETYWQDAVHSRDEARGHSTIWLDSDQGNASSMLKASAYHHFKSGSNISGSEDKTLFIGLGDNPFTGKDDFAITGYVGQKDSVETNAHITNCATVSGMTYANEINVSGNNYLLANNHWPEGFYGKTDAGSLTVVNEVTASTGEKHADKFPYLPDVNIVRHLPNNKYATGNSCLVYTEAAGKDSTSNGIAKITSGNARLASINENAIKGNTLQILSPGYNDSVSSYSGQMSSLINSYKTDGYTTSGKYLLRNVGYTQGGPASEGHAMNDIVIYNPITAEHTYVLNQSNELPDAANIYHDHINTITTQTTALTGYAQRQTAGDVNTYSVSGIHDNVYGRNNTALSHQTNNHSHYEYTLKEQAARKGTEYYKASDYAFTEEASDTEHVIGEGSRVRVDIDSTYSFKAKGKYFTLNLSAGDEFYVEHNTLYVSYADSRNSKLSYNTLKSSLLNAYRTRQATYDNAVSLVTTDAYMKNLQEKRKALLDYLSSYHGPTKLPDKPKYKTATGSTNSKKWLYSAAAADVDDYARILDQDKVANNVNGIDNPNGIFELDSLQSGKVKDCGTAFNNLYNSMSKTYPYYYVRSETRTDGVKSFRAVFDTLKNVGDNSAEGKLDYILVTYDMDNLHINAPEYPNDPTDTKYNIPKLDLWSTTFGTIDTKEAPCEEGISSYVDTLQNVYTNVSSATHTYVNQGENGHDWKNDEWFNDQQYHAIETFIDKDYLTRDQAEANSLNGETAGTSKDYILGCAYDKCMADLSTYNTNSTTKRRAYDCLREAYTYVPLHDTYNIARCDANGKSYKEVNGKLVSLPDSELNHYRVYKYADTPHIIRVLYRVPEGSSYKGLQWYVPEDEEDNYTILDVKLLSSNTEDNSYTEYKHNDGVMKCIKAAFTKAYKIYDTAIVADTTYDREWEAYTQQLNQYYEYLKRLRELGYSPDTVANVRRDYEQRAVVLPTDYSSYIREINSTGRLILVKDTEFTVDMSSVKLHKGGVAEFSFSTTNGVIPELLYNSRDVECTFTHSGNKCTCYFEAKEDASIGYVPFYFHSNTEIEKQQEYPITIKDTFVFDLGEGSESVNSYTGVTPTTFSHDINSASGYNYTIHNRGYGYNGYVLASVTTISTSVDVNASFKYQRISRRQSWGIKSDSIDPHKVPNVNWKYYVVGWKTDDGSVITGPDDAHLLDASTVLYWPSGTGETVTVGDLNNHACLVKWNGTIYLTTTNAATSHKIMQIGYQVEQFDTIKFNTEVTATAPLQVIDAEGYNEESFYNHFSNYAYEYCFKCSTTDRCLFYIQYSNNLEFKYSIEADHFSNDVGADWKRTEVENTVITTGLHKEDLSSNYISLDDEFELYWDNVTSVKSDSTFMNSNVTTPKLGYGWKGDTLRYLSGAEGGIRDWVQDEDANDRREQLFEGKVTWNKLDVTPADSHYFATAQYPSDYAHSYGFQGTERSNHQSIVDNTNIDTTAFIYAKYITFNFPVYIFKSPTASGEMQDYCDKLNAGGNPTLGAFTQNADGTATQNIPISIPAGTPIYLGYYKQAGAGSNEGTFYDFGAPEFTQDPNITASSIPTKNDRAFHYHFWCQLATGESDKGLEANFKVVSINDAKAATTANITTTNYNTTSLPDSRQDNYKSCAQAAFNSAAANDPVNEAEGKANNDQEDKYNDVTALKTTIHTSSVGRIGALTVVDSGDPRFSDTFKYSLLLNSPDGNDLEKKDMFLIYPIIQLVSKYTHEEAQAHGTQAKFATDPYDVRGRISSTVNLKKFLGKDLTEIGNTGRRKYLGVDFAAFFKAGLNASYFDNYHSSSNIQWSTTSNKVGVAKDTDITGNAYAHSASRMSTYNTYGTQWFKEKTDVTSNEILPIGEGFNRHEALELALARLGYDYYCSIETVGNYYGNSTSTNNTAPAVNGNGDQMQEKMQIRPVYIGLQCETGDGQLIDGQYLDVYMRKGDSYVLINSGGVLSTNGDWDSPLSVLKNNYNPVYLNHNTLDYSASEVSDALDQTVLRHMITRLEWKTTYEVQEGRYSTQHYASTNLLKQNKVVTDDVLDAGHRTYQYGCAQFLFLRDHNMTYIGGATGALNYPCFVEETDNHNGMTTYNKQTAYSNAQRWHFSLGLPSSAVFVLHGQKCTEANIIKTGFILTTIDTYVRGDVWTLHYESEVSKLKLQIGGKEYTYDKWHGGKGVNEVPADFKFLVPVNVYAVDENSTMDLDTTGTH